MDINSISANDISNIKNLNTRNEAAVTVLAKEQQIQREQGQQITEMIANAGAVPVQPPTQPPIANDGSTINLYA